MRFLLIILLVGMWICSTNVDSNKNVSQDGENLVKCATLNSSIICEKNFHNEKATTFKATLANVMFCHINLENECDGSKFAHCSCNTPSLNFYTITLTIPTLKMQLLKDDKIMTTDELQCNNAAENSICACECTEKLIISNLSTLFGCIIILTVWKICNRAGGTSVGKFDDPEHVHKDTKYYGPENEPLLRNAVQTQCGHRLCESCVNLFLSLDSSQHCPKNEEDCTANKSCYRAFPDADFCKEIHQLLVFCPNIECDVKTKFSLLASHLRDCPFRKVRCRDLVKDCSNVNEISYAEKHPFPTVSTKLCSQDFNADKQTGDETDPLIKKHRNDSVDSVCTVNEVNPQSHSTPVDFSHVPWRPDDTYVDSQNIKVKIDRAVDISLDDASYLEKHPKAIGHSAKKKLKVETKESTIVLTDESYPSKNSASSSKADNATDPGFLTRDNSIQDNLVSYKQKFGSGGVHKKCPIKLLKGNQMNKNTFEEQPNSKSLFKVELGSVWITTYGPGLQGGVVNQPAVFTVETNGEVSALDLLIEGPSQTKRDCKNNRDDSVDVTYWPTQVGDYTIRILYNDLDIPNSPYVAKILPVQSFIARKVNVKGPALEKNRVQFSVDPRFAESKAHLNITCMDVEYKPLEVQVKDNDDGTFTCSYQPTRNVKHTVIITYGGVMISDAPFRVYMTERSIPAKVKMYGPVVEEELKTLSSTHFCVNLKEAGPELEDCLIVKPAVFTYRKSVSGN